MPKRAVLATKWSFERGLIHYNWGGGPVNADAKAKTIMATNFEKYSHHRGTEHTERNYWNHSLCALCLCGDFFALGAKLIDAPLFELLLFCCVSLGFLVKGLTH